MREMLFALTLVTIAVVGYAADPICVDARRLQCDPNLAKCLAGAGSEERTATCMQRFNACTESKRMSEERCARVVQDLEAASAFKVPRGRPW